MEDLTADQDIKFAQKISTLVADFLCLTVSIDTTFKISIIASRSQTTRQCLKGDIVNIFPSNELATKMADDIGEATQEELSRVFEDMRRELIDTIAVVGMWIRDQTSVLEVTPVTTAVTSENKFVGPLRGAILSRIGRMSEENLRDLARELRVLVENEDFRGTWGELFIKETGEIAFKIT